jgi:hypothetical protein
MLVVSMGINWIGHIYCRIIQPMLYIKIKEQLIMKSIFLAHAGGTTKNLSIPRQSARKLDHSLTLGILVFYIMGHPCS